MNKKSGSETDFLFLTVSFYALELQKGSTVFDCTEEEWTTGAYMMIIQANKTAISKHNTTTHVIAKAVAWKKLLYATKKSCCMYKLYL